MIEATITASTGSFHGTFPSSDDLHKAVAMVASGAQVRQPMSVDLSFGNVALRVHSGSCAGMALAIDRILEALVNLDEDAIR